MAVENTEVTPSTSNDVSASLELLVSKTPERDVVSSVSYAEAEVMVTEPNAARVSTIFKANRRTLMLLMEYRRDLRSKLVFEPDIMVEPTAEKRGGSP